MTSSGRSGWLIALLALAACGPPPVPDELVFKRANLVILSIDTLRADRLGAYGNDRGLTPVLDALARESVVFESCFANSPKTASSHMSLFTSMLPTAHGVTNFSPRQKIPLVRVADNRLTLGQILNRAKYWNVTVASGGNLQPDMGFAKGFQGRFESANREVGEIITRSLTYADRGSRQSIPMYLFTHTYQVHGPYVPPDEYRLEYAPDPSPIVGALVEKMVGLPFQQQWKLMHGGLWDHKADFGPDDARYLSDLYDAEIAYTDAELERFFEGLADLGFDDDTILMVLSDHGEEFAEHGDYEHDQLYREHLHVPLMIRLPGGILGGTRVKGQCSLIDVMPTLLDLLGLKGPEGQMMGTSLVPAMLSGRTDDQPFVAERVMYADDYRAAMRSPAANVVFRAREGCLEAYDLSSDPGEQQDVAWSAPFFDRAADGLEGSLRRIWALRDSLDRVSQGQAASLDDDAMRELQELGYLGDGETDADIVLPQGTPLERWPASEAECRR